MIINELGNEFLPEGYALGNWMVQESFLFGTGAFSADFKPFMRAEGMDRTRSIHQILTETCGRSYAEAYWDRFYKNYVQEEDIRLMAEHGFNTLRIPLNGRMFLEEEPEICFVEKRFEILDRIIAWCDQYGIYAVIDMHAATAGQSGVSCDDGVDNMPHLFLDENERERTIRLWEKLAERYKDKACVAGYELLNEPIAMPFFDHLIPELLSFYDECIARIRKIDKKHIIFLQGNRFASRWDMFRKDMDPQNNWVLTIHIYELLPDLGLFGPILQARDELDVPVWIGETGGSTNWTTVCFEMLRQYHIGYNVWVYKAVDRKDAPTMVSYNVPEDMKEITAYALQGKKKPSYEKARRIFDQYLECIRYENCILHDNAVKAIRRTRGAVIPAIGYDVTPDSFHGNYPYCHFCGYRREDHLEFVLPSGVRPYEAPGFAKIAAEKVPKYGEFNRLMLKLNEGEYVSYTFRNIEKPAQLKITAYTSHGMISISAHDHTENCTLDNTGETVLSCMMLPEGEKVTCRITCTSGTAVLKNIFTE